MLWRFLALALLALLAVSAAACGDDDEDVTDNTGGETTAPAANGTEPPAGETDAPAETGGNGGGEPVTVDLTAEGFAFSLDAISAPAGSTVTVEFENADSAFHTFTVDSLDISEQLDGGESATITFTMPDSETEFYCAFHRAQMTGSLAPDDAGAQSNNSAQNNSDGDSDDNGDDGYIY